MGRQEFPVVAVVPAFNEQERLGMLLLQLCEQEYDKVYAIDDASTDNTAEVIKSWHKDVTGIYGKENVGSGANRNRIIPELGYSAIIHFVDADTSINSNRNPERAREIVADPKIGFAGGLIRRPDGTQHTWNYGPPYSLPQMFSSWLYAQNDRLAREWPKIGQRIREPMNKWSLMAQWPDVTKAPLAKEAYWACEGNLVMRSDLFSAVGGYDQSLRYHEAIDLAMKLDELGLKRLFDPSIDVTHHNNPKFNNANTKDFWTAQYRLARKMGAKRFLTGAS